MNEDTPKSEKSERRTADMRRYRKDYWERFKETRKRVYGTLTVEEYESIEARAKAAGRAVWSQIHAEAEAYARGDYVPTKEIEGQITDLILQMRAIGNNINQITRDMHTDGVLDKTELARAFAALEARINHFVSQPWRRPDDNDEDADT